MSGIGSGWKISLVLLFTTTSVFKFSDGIPDYCFLEPFRGPCKDRVFMYYFDHVQQTCLTFIYGGCRVNNNVFESFDACMDKCTRNESEVTTTTTTQAPTREELYIQSFKNKPYVVLANGTGESTFTFASPSSYIQIGPHEISDYQIRDRRSVSLEFRTRLPHALLVYHGIKDLPAYMKKYELYIMLDQGQLRVKHLFGDYSTTVIVGKGLNRDKFHKVNVMIDPNKRIIQASVDEDNTTMTIDGLEEIPYYGATDQLLESIIFIGGLEAVHSEEHLDISYLANPFVGCIRNVALDRSPTRSLPLEPVTGLVSSRFLNVEEKCVNKCWDARQPCSYDSKCINFYDHVECDCFDARFKGDECRFASIPLLSLYGYSYVTFTVYEWMDRVHSDANRISVHFRTRVDDSILFYAAGEIPYHNHIAATIQNHKLFVSLDFGDELVPPFSVDMGEKVTDGEWHVLTMDHQGKSVTINLDGKGYNFEIKGNHHHLYIDPDIYVGGGGPRLKNRQGLNSSNNFVGCIKEVYFNEKSILWELYAKRHQAQYHGLSDEAVFREHCNLESTVPITIPFAESGFRISIPAREEDGDEAREQLNFSLEFRTAEVFTTLAYSEIRTLKGKGFWELQLMNDNIQFVLYTDTDKELAETSSSKPLSAKFNRSPTEWVSVELKYLNGEIHLSTDRQQVSEKFPELFLLSRFITLGTSVNKPNTGFVGCVRQIQIDGKHIDTRKIVGSDDQIGDITMDNCQFADPCKRPKVCEHGGKCSLQNGEVTCDCSETGYIGKHCHFAIFKRTCEELALLGYTDSGVYKIDIDGNGPFSPAHVKCKFETDSSGETKTIVEHNLEEHTDIWVPNEKPVDFRLYLNYREFSPEMLMSLVSQSVQCSQNIKYDCYKAQLSLQRSSWFRAADPKSISVVSIADADRNTCPCYMTKSCAGGKVCNCDSMQDKWLSDEGSFSIPERLGITELYFMAPNNLTSDSASRITLGPLECVEANTQRYVVTFKTFGSYLEAPGWKTGDLAFSFRTTRTSAILLYQPLLHPQHNAFSVFLTNEHELVFQFILNGGPPERVVVRSQRPLSGGDWQQVWIDYDLHQVRFQINAEHQMINLPDGQLFGPFESTMYIAGAPSKYLEQETDTIVEDGLIGCFRGLVMNGQVVDLYSYMKFHKADIVKDCSPSCDPSPCKNKAICQENWGSFTCQCLNPWAQSGQFCENDINVDGLTFLSQSSFIKKAQMNAAADPVRNILTSNIYANLRTYDEVALVVYANDNLNNFIQIHIEDGTKVIFTWNHGDTIRQLKVEQKALNHGKQIQIAVTRNQSSTSLHVNHENATAFVGISLLSVYSPTPWTNPELETFAPPRPFASVNTYYQLLLGGYDWNALKPSNGTNIPGMLGCLKGLKVGNDAIKISDLANHQDVLEGCKMVCDTKPCGNSGLCIEDFQARTYSCDCIHTSYFGKTCSDEKGANFGGESFMRRIFKYSSPTVTNIEAHFGFSTSYSDTDTLLLVVSMPNQAYSLLFAINKEGHLMVKEERDGMVFDAAIRYQNFVDGSRHSVYFERSNNETVFIVDQEEIHLTSKVPLVPKAIETVKDATVGEVFVAGVMDAVTAYTRFRRFKGCLSNVVVKVGNIETRALEEFFAFRKKEPDAILDVEKHDGIKLGPCAAFSLFRLPPASENSPQGELTPAAGGSNWVLESPTKVQIHMRPPAQVESVGVASTTLPIICGTFLLCVIIFVLIYTYRINKRYQRRKLEDFDDDDTYFTHRGHPVRYQDPLATELQYTGYSKIDPETTNLITKASAPTFNNNEARLSEANSNLRKGNGAGQQDTEADQGIDDENASSDTSSDGKRSHVSSTSSLSLNATQALDDKSGEPILVPNGSASLPNCTPIEEVTESEDHDDEPIPRLPSVRPTRRNLSPTPFYLSPTMRTMETSPIALIGGQRYADMKRTSKDSILSLD